MGFENEMKLEILSKSQNEAFARVVVGAFASQLDPTIEEIADVFKLGAHSVVVGTSITRPEIITARYVQGVNNYLNKF
jgi:putative N-acetylmannosamine-6-phosphate epimerase